MYYKVLMIGPPGSGKTMLAKRFPTILPEMSRQECLEVTKIYSVAGLLKEEIPMVTQRPYRSPHHTISGIALVGGGRIPKPGEVSLAHHGVLFLDEFAEFQTASLEGLRQPMEDGCVTIARVNASVTYPASFMLLGSMNPCPCGYYNDPTHACHCTKSSIDRYLQRVSGPILDRIDIVSQVNVEDYEKLKGSTTESETSEQIRSRVEYARKIQRERYDSSNTGINCNARMTSRQIDQYCALGSAETALMKAAFERYRLSARSYHRVLKLARTIADLKKKALIEVSELSEALQYRGFDQQYFS